MDFSKMFVLCLFRADTLTGGPGSPFSPGDPASAENWVGSRSNVWKPSVAAGVTGVSEVGLTSSTLVTFGSDFFGATVVSCFLLEKWAFEGDPCVEAAVLWRVGFISDDLVKTGKCILFPEGCGELVSACFVFFMACEVGFGGVMLIPGDVVTDWVGTLDGLSSLGWTVGETDTSPGFGVLFAIYTDVLFNITESVEGRTVVLMFSSVKAKLGVRAFLDISIKERGVMWVTVTFGSVENRGSRGGNTGR